MRADHNAVQLEHYAGPGLTSPRMQPVDTPYVRRHVDRLVEQLDLRPGMRVLDVGCGLGKFTRILADVHSLEVEGLDLSPDLARVLAADREDIPVHVGDVRLPPRALSGRYDAVTGFFVLHHLADLSAPFTGIRSLLVPGGTAAFIEPNALCPLFWMQITVTPGLTWRAERGVLRMTGTRLRAGMRAAGFSGVQHRTTGLLPPVLANRPWGAAVDEWVDRRAWSAPVRAFAVVSGRRSATA